MEKEITINGKKYLVKEIKYKDITKMGQVAPEVMAKEIMKLSTGITDEEFDNLSMKEGIEVQKLVNEVNGLSNFQ